MRGRMVRATRLECLDRSDAAVCAGPVLLPEQEASAEIVRTASAQLARPPTVPIGPSAEIVRTASAKFEAELEPRAALALGFWWE